jgi:hypothetical protein
VQPQILFPILVFAFAIGTFFITFFSSVNVELDEPLDVELLTHEEFLQMERELAKREEVANKGRDSWLDVFQESHIKDHDYPAKEVSIHMPLYKPAKMKGHTLSTEYLEPYHNFCVNQVLKKVRRVRYKVVEKGDKIKFIITTPSKDSIQKIIKELNFYDIRSIVLN